jgi:hypothetical protein
MLVLTNNLLHNLKNKTDKVVLDDVYFGDVWLCSGQNNMQFTVNMAFNASQEITLANNYPHICLFTRVGQGAILTQPQPPLKPMTQLWSVANATLINGQPWTHFSAICWFYGKELYNQYKVPISLVSSNWGSTTMQAWSSPNTLKKCKAFEGTIIIFVIFVFIIFVFVILFFVIVFIDIMALSCRAHQGAGHQHGPKQGFRVNLFLFTFFDK